VHPRDLRHALALERGEQEHRPVLLDGAPAAAREPQEVGRLLVTQLTDEQLGRLLAARGLTPDEVPLYLEPTLREQLPDPARFKDMEKAVARLVAAIAAGEKIAVWGDYDVDGATSAALLLRYFNAIGHPIEYYIPDRMREGYGPNAPALLKLRSDGVAVVITVDCGITAHEPLAPPAKPAST
jgi:single-stranded-DNA-specific exonuclease